MRRQIRVAIAGIGNCASSLVQGVAHYSRHRGSSGLINRKIGPYRPSNISFVLAFDIDVRKVGLPLNQAIFSKPNLIKHVNPEEVPVGPPVLLAPIFDGVSPHMTSDERGYMPAPGTPVDVTAALKKSKTDVLACYLPVGAERAVHHFAEACLSAGVAFVNCVPVFIASDPSFARRFADAGVPVIGDDIRSQVGATIVHQRLLELLVERGFSIESTYQINIGGNSDFLNMLSRDRLISKKQSKTNALMSRVETAITDKITNSVHAGPADYVPHLKDTKVAYINVRANGFCDAPLLMEMRLSVEDSPNSAGVAIDAIRYAALSRAQGMAGAIRSACAYYMKSPPEYMSDIDALKELENLFG